MRRRWIGTSSSGLEQAIATPCRNGNPQWSPDGTRILFFRLVDVGGGQTHTDLFQMRADGTDVVRVTNDPDDDYYADWGTYPLVN